MLNTLIQIFISQHESTIVIIKQISWAKLGSLLINNNDDDDDDDDDDIPETRKWGEGSSFALVGNRSRYGWCLDKNKNWHEGTSNRHLSL